jgi:hypothetical protein
MTMLMIYKLFCAQIIFSRESEITLLGVNDQLVEGYGNEKIAGQFN